VKREHVCCSAAANRGEASGHRQFDQAVRQLRALGGVSFDVHSGEWVALMGPPAPGKTTLINILGGLDTLTSGHVVVDGVDLSKLRENELVR